MDLDRSLNAYLLKLDKERRNAHVEALESGEERTMLVGTNLGHSTHSSLSTAGFGKWHFEHGDYSLDTYERPAKDQQGRWSRK